ncbi:MAG: ATP phosphoribosyltransferase [Planctomycetota bacterium]|nr:MAG: ATP phosphoribosyltransferase [Planctomycetota bacterium]
MSPKRDGDVLRLALPKGRIAEGVLTLLSEAGVRLRHGPRQYRPVISLPDFEVKILKPQAIVQMLRVGSRDLGFTGADWVAEFDADLVELFDTGLDPVRLVAAAPAGVTLEQRVVDGPFIVASEYERLTRRWIARRGLDATVLRSFGATEVYPPEDADCIVDVVATGATLAAHGLEILDELMTSSTRLYASPAVIESPSLRRRAEDFVMLLRSVLEARRRVMVELNVSTRCLEHVVAMLPCMREPTVSPLHGGAGYAVKVAVPRDELPMLIPQIRALGGSDIVVTSPVQIVP